MIPVNEPIIGTQEETYVLECLRTGWISSSGRFIEAFEQAWAAYCGMAHGVAVSNGSTALQTAVACFGFEAGFQVVMPSFTIISCALAVMYNGGTPVLVDCDPRTWCMDVEEARRKIERDRQQDRPRIEAIMPVHIYGHPVDMDPLLELAQRYDLKIIEDAAEAHGAECLTGRNAPGRNGKDAAAWATSALSASMPTNSLPPAKGAWSSPTTPSWRKGPESKKPLLPSGTAFSHTELGHNFRLTNIQAAIGLAQIERMEDIVAKKRWMGEAYAERLRHIPGLQLPVEEPWAKQVYWMYGIVLDEATGWNAGPSRKG